MDAKRSVRLPQPRGVSGGPEWWQDRHGRPGMAADGYVHRPREEGTMTQRIGWGLIGASRIAADQMIDAIRAQDGSEVVAVMSSDPERGAAFAREHGIERFHSDVGTLLADPGVNAVYISTTPDLHCTQTVAAAEAGKHVLCEKPLALSVADARRMVDACAAAGVEMATNHHLRNAVSHRAIRDIVRDGRIGRVLAARICWAVVLPERYHTWRTNDRERGGPILDLSVHNADTLRFLLHDEPLDVVARSANHGLTAPGIEDTAMSVVRFRGGALVQTFQTWVANYVESDIEIIGSAGSVRARDVMMPDSTGTVVLRTAAGETALDLEHEPLYVRGVRLFTRTMRGEGSSPCTGEDGVRSLALALAIREAAATGARVAIET